MKRRYPHPVRLPAHRRETLLLLRQDTRRCPLQTRPVDREECRLAPALTPNFGGGLRSKGAESQSRRTSKKQNALGTAVTAPRAKHPREDAHGCTKTLLTGAARCQRRSPALFHHLQPPRVCRDHGLAQKPVSRWQRGGTSRKMGVMNMNGRPKCPVFF